MKNASFKQEAGKRLLAKQRKGADYLNAKARDWNKARKIIFLCAVCCLFTAGILCNMISRHPAERHVLPAIRLPPPQDSILSKHFLPQKK